MEGKAYWIFLLIMYGLSALMKRRQQAAARKKILAQDESFSEKPQKTVEPRDIFRELFDADWLEEEKPPVEPVVERTVPPWPEEESFEPVSAPETPEPAAEITPTPGAPDVATAPEPDKKEAGLSETVTRVTRARGINAQLLYLLKNKSALKNSIMVREILDKPRALRRHIR